MKPQSVEKLAARRVIIIADLKAKADVEDWHGVADAAMDLREIDAQLDMYGHWRGAIRDPSD